jgi:hypothetical protein
MSGGQGGVVRRAFLDRQIRANKEVRANVGTCHASWHWNRLSKCSDGMRSGMSLEARRRRPLLISYVPRNEGTRRPQLSVYCRETLSYNKRLEFSFADRQLFSGGSEFEYREVNYSRYDGFFGAQRRKTALPVSS